MALFSKAERFPPEKPSDVPGPGAYDPKLHDPLDDHWRKGPLEIYTVPRDKKFGDPGPDTFGLYNPDLSIPQPSPAKPHRQRAISTHAPSSSNHQKDLLRLESALCIRESRITSLTETLQGSEQASKELRRALHRSELDNSGLKSEVEKMRKQLQSVSGLHSKVVELQEEHDRSKKRRDKEIGQLKDQLRQADERASRYFEDKKQMERDLERLRRDSEDAHGSHLAGFRRASEQLVASFTHAAAQRDASARDLKLFKVTSRLADVRTQKMLADRAAQVGELVELVNEATLREEFMHQFAENLIEEGAQTSAQVLDSEAVLQLERTRHKHELEEVEKAFRTHEELFDGIFDENKVELEAVFLESRYLQTELEGFRMVNKALEDALGCSCVAYNDLSNACRLTTTKLDRVQAELAARDHTIAELTSTLEMLQVELVGQKEHAKRLVHIHASAAEAWQARQAALEARVREAEVAVEKEREGRRMVASELLVARQAEAALRGEVEHAQTLSATLHETEQELVRQTHLNDLLIRQSDLNADQVEKIGKVNEELGSHGNSKQRVRVLERLRREIREEKENTVKLENSLWTAQSEIKSLKDELAAYRSVSHPSCVRPAGFKTGGGLERGARRPLMGGERTVEERVVLREVGHHPNQDLAGKPDSDPAPGPCPADKPVVVPSSRIAQPKKPTGTAHMQYPRTSKVPTFKALVAQRMVGKSMSTSEGVGEEENVQCLIGQGVAAATGAGALGDVSLGAVKMQGKMTLEELR